MKFSHASLPILMAGLLAAAGAYAQSTPPAGSSDLPPKAGEASTQKQGVPNATTTNSTAGEAPMSNKDARKEAQNMGAAASTSTPMKPGDATTMVQGKPNADMDKPHAMSRAEVRAELMGRRAAFEAERKSMRKQG